MTAGAIVEASQKRETPVGEEDSSKRKRLGEDKDGDENGVQTKRPRDDSRSELSAGGSGEGTLSYVLNDDNVVRGVCDLSFFGPTFYRSRPRIVHNAVANVESVHARISTIDIATEAINDGEEVQQVSRLFSTSGAAWLAVICRRARLIMRLMYAGLICPL